MKTVLLRASLLSQSGYGTHGRQIARWLLSKESDLGLDLTFDILNWGITPWQLNTDAHDGLIGKIISKTGNKKPIYDVAISLQLPNEWDPSLGKYNIGITAGVETDKCNPLWIDSINRMNLVIVPSEFSKTTFVNTASVLGKQLTTPIVVIPESFPDVLLTQPTKKLDLELNTPFNFLLFGQFTGNNPDNDRKNLFYSIKWFCEAFADDKDVGLVIKTNLARNSKIDRQATSNLLAKLVSEVRKTDFPKIYLLHGEMSDEEIASLYRHPKIKGLLTLTRAEGFGLPILEAAASGLPVLATDWSAHTEFLNLGKFIKFDYVLKDVHLSRVDNAIFVPGVKWAEVKEDDVKRKLKKFKDASTVPGEWAEQLQKTIIEKYNFNTISQTYDKTLIGLLK